MRRIIMHIDVNSAFLNWEAAYRISTGDTFDLRGIPSVVGGDRAKRHGVVLAKSYECKKYGIVTGEPIAQALKKCPGLVVVPPRFSVYEDYSRKLAKLVNEYSDCVERYSIDELFLDFTYMKSYFGDEIKTADEIRRRCREELGFTVCVGVGSNKLLAKMATELRKPDFTNTLYAYELEKMWALPVGELFMVGRRSTEKLINLGIRTIGELAKADPKMLVGHFKSYGRMIWEYANGIDDSPVSPEHGGPKSISSETTLSSDVTALETGKTVLLEICERICSELRGGGLLAETVTVNVRTSDFKDYGHGRKLPSPTDNTTEVYNFAVALLKEMWHGEPLRLMGVRLSGLGHEQSVQLSLFDPADADKKRAVDAAIDGIRGKYGFNAVTRASLIEASAKPAPEPPKAPQQPPRR